MDLKNESKNIEGIAVEYVIPENKKYSAPLFFVHGSSCGSWIWENFFSYFSSMGWSCYAINLRGHYLSEPVKNWGEIGVDAYVEDIKKVIGWIGKEVIFIGHSMGGVLGQKYSESKNPLKLILLHTAPPKRVVSKIDFDAFLKRGSEKGRVFSEKVVQSDGNPQNLLGYMFDKGNVSPEVLKMASQKMCMESKRALLEMKDVEVDAAKIKCPVYVLGFNLKKIGVNYPIDLSQELVRYYKAKDYGIIEPGGHMFMLEKNWDEFAKLIEKWLLE